MSVTELDAWKTLSALAARDNVPQPREQLNANGDDWQQKRFSACGISVDFSRQQLDSAVQQALYELAEQTELVSWRERLFSGDKINQTEQRAVLHTALRLPADADSPRVDGEPVLGLVHEQLDRLEAFCHQVYSGQWRGYSGESITDVVNIGIGGSDLGPKMVCQALAHCANPGLTTHFVSNLDPADLDGVLAKLDPQRTLFLVASKTFTTLETMSNARWARQWFLAKTAQQGDVSKHFVALSANVAGAVDFGIAPESVFAFWDWVGGRFSLWSTVGAAIALGLGMDNFRALLAGAHQMDQHFRQAPASENLPLNLALVGIWNNNFRDIGSLAVLPYNHALGALPDYLQQLEMESNGKRVNRDGQLLDYRSCPVLWGNIGINAQHAFYQLLHQGTHPIACDMIFAKPPAVQQFDPGDGQRDLAASWLGQMEAMLQGRQTEQLVQAGVDEALQPHKFFPGNRPHTAIYLDELSPQRLGALIALYEHKVFCQGVIWQVNSFDQWGVELGKQLTTSLAASLNPGASSAAHDPSTQALIEQWQQS